MACYRPLPAWQLECGKVVFSERGAVRRSLVLPCGQCVGCRLERSRQWAVRCMHEAKCHEANSFVTLTYDKEHNCRSLDYRHFQLFMKKARRKLGPFRFYMCGEYGDLHWRPHYHALLFGASFADAVIHRNMASGFKLYRSATLESLWPHGYSSIGDVTFESAAYVARYVVKKITGSAAAEHYKRFDKDTGEIFDLEPEFTHMSLKPGIGAEWIAKYRKEVYPRDYVVVRGVKCKPPRYYDNFCREVASEDFDYVEYTRYVNSFVGIEHTTDERLAVREQVARARLNFKLRTLE